MMNKTDFLNIIEPKLKTAYGSQGMFVGESRVEQVKMWYESMKNYNRIDVEKAITTYITKNKFKPLPADIIELLPSAKYNGEPFDKTPRYDPNGNRIYKCLRCKDMGLITWEDNEGRAYGRPCNCAAGYYYYGSGHEEEKRKVVN